MKWGLYALGIILGLSFWHFMIGSGGLEGKLTLSGWYAVENVEGYPVVCFAHATRPLGTCIPKSQLGTSNESH